MFFRRDAKSYIEARGELKRTALWGAVERGDETMPKLLVKRGAKLEAKAGSGQSPL